MEVGFAGSERHDERALLCAVLLHIVNGGLRSANSPEANNTLVQNGIALT